MSVSQGLLNAARSHPNPDSVWWELSTFTSEPDGPPHDTARTFGSQLSFLFGLMRSAGVVPDDMTFSTDGAGWRVSLPAETRLFLPYAPSGECFQMSQEITFDSVQESVAGTSGAETASNLWGLLSASATVLSDARNALKTRPFSQTGTP